MFPLLQHIVLTLSLFVPTYGFSAGAPPLPSVCRDMVPRHHDYKPQTSASPYLISTSAAEGEVDGGSVVKILINATDGATKIRGFYIQARDSETGVPIGTFAMSPQVSSHSCKGKRWNAATHTNSNEKGAIEIEWTAPTDYEGEVLILGTVLKDWVTFWSGNYAEPFSVTRKSKPESPAAAAPQGSSPGRARSGGIVRQWLRTFADRLG